MGAVLLSAVASGLVVQEQSLFLVFLALWMIVAPTYGLCNSLAMRNLDHPAKEFGGVRLWGTIGWMVVGWLVSVVMTVSGSTRAGGGAYEAFWIATTLALLTALYCTTLPETPPLAGRGQGAASLAEALQLAREPDIAVLLITSFGVYLTTPLVYQVMPRYLESRDLPRVWTSTVMTIGQWPEIASLIVLPWLLRRMGYKRTIALGVFGWFARFLSLCLHPPLWLAVWGALLHGVGVGCFTVGSQVYLDQRAPARQRATAQGIFLMLTSGLGSLIGNLTAGRLMGTGSLDDVLVFLIPCVINGAMLIYFLTGFRPHVSTVDRAGASNADLPPRLHKRRGTVGCVGNLATESADG
jgi:hypothetical protein